MPERLPVSRLIERARRIRQRRRRVQRRTADAAITLAGYLRTETIGGIVMLAAAIAALAVANSPAAGLYQHVRDARFGPEALHLSLTTGEWAADGLLTLFFVIAGLELKRELAVGELRNPRTAMLPVFGAIGGMVVPALVALIVGHGTAGIDQAWAVPVATDIAFALAVLAVTARTLPASVRVFLLTLAVVDDLGAILLIAVLFTAHLAVLPLIGAAASIGGYLLLQRLRFRGWPVYLALGVLAWVLLHTSGIHATLAGVAIGLATRVRRDPGEAHAPAEYAEHRLQPISAGVCVPIFAFFAAGVSLSGGALPALVTDRLAWAIVAGLVVGKAIGVFGGALLAIGLRLARLPSTMHWRDLAAVSVLAGCGFTVSLLIAELAFGVGEEGDRLKTAVLAGSIIAAVLATFLLRRRVRAHHG
ncbi:Na(+)/H(+) antiporter NhaA [Actinocatenispora thailandica]|uniref:Na(+)/H(+) antiporter NhaA n=1 Tax=Actinocatenispora thailandica TaxID=227318 RepID=A0A7R7I075_9ACTN|nr:Na+/H+ antiporter NhaA [Actinocatenispora thailandica]BCJ38194.1 Na(+)/H(+) antiporter NhaA [Actinocatenispora thailandica]